MAREHLLRDSKAAGFEVRCQIVWAKNTFAWGFGRYKFQHEPIFYCHVAGEKDAWYGDRSQSTLWQENKPSANQLDEWRISPAMTAREDLKPRTLGGIRWDKAKKSAVIWILDPADYRLPVCRMLDDIEMTIVHELIHLRLASLPRSDASRSSEEHAVNGIAEALLALDRTKQ